jgi:hypothetical protein
MRLGVLLLCLFASSPVLAEPAPTKPTKPRKNLAYVEVLGKAGPYGVGYERSISPRISFGGVASYALMRDQHIATASPYLHARLRGRGKHTLFGELGAVIVHSRIPSPVPEWDGVVDTGAGGVAALGWQRAGRRFVLRAHGAILVGEGGVAPWGGFAIGFRR